MGLDNDIYDARLTADAKRQPRHKPHLEELVTALQRLTPPKLHPYSLEERDYNQLDSNPAYRSTCAGFSATINNDYCYRISAAQKLQRFTLGLQLRELASVTPVDAFRYLEQESAGRGWLPLRRFLGGKVSGPRDLTWWTTLELPSSNLLCQGHRMGLPNESVPVRAVVLRCPTAYVRRHSLAFVPTILDAFYLQIFRATSDADAPRSGTTINLEDPKLLKEGVEEYVVRPLDIDGGEIEVLPVDLTNENRHNVHLSDVVEPLLAYYQAA